jgi:hypothetical protein
LKGKWRDRLKNPFNYSVLNITSSLCPYFVSAAKLMQKSNGTSLENAFSADAEKGNKKTKGYYVNSTGSQGSLYGA